MTGCGLGGWVSATLLMAAALGLALSGCDSRGVGTNDPFSVPSAGRVAGFEPASVRAAARAAGLDALGTVPIPEAENLGEFLKPDAGARMAAIRLGKALFWDMQLGSDGQACASCHFHAGADSRSRNQLSPGLRNLDPALRGVFNATASGLGGPDTTLTAADFPFHLLRNTEENNFNLRVVLFDTDDVVSSQGVFAADFTGVTAGISGDQGTPFADPVFNLLTPTPASTGDNVRRVATRNTPTIINAAFNHSSGWDGRAHNLFNGVSMAGPLDPAAMIWVADAVGKLSQAQVRIPDASLASQAVGPPQSDLEMSFLGRPFPLIGRKLLSLNPLGLQYVHPQDSVLGSLSRAGQNRNGIDHSYVDMIRQAFQPMYWDSDQLTPEGYTLMEANFALFFGLAIQMYESTLVSELTPFDRFMAGDDRALAEEQLWGLVIFINRGKNADGSSRNPAVVDALIAEEEADYGVGFRIGAGNCVGCHAGPELTAAAFSNLAEAGKRRLIQTEETAELTGGLLALNAEKGLQDRGFSNIGVRPTNEDPGRGGQKGGLPLSFSRLALAGLVDRLPEGAELPCTAGVDCPDRVQVDGAFKVPGLRNVELTGPYFHNGGQATLSQVVEFYDRQGDFGDVNIDHLDGDIVFVDLDEADEGPLLAFLLGLTDERVRSEMAPFDHPQLIIPNGGTFPFELRTAIPAVGAGGRPAAGLPPLGTFLGLAQGGMD